MAVLLHSGYRLFAAAGFSARRLARIPRLADGLALAPVTSVCGAYAIRDMTQVGGVA
jgi:hypothetical protein